MSHGNPSDLGDLLHRIAKVFHDRPALSAAGERFTYRDLFEWSAGIAMALGESLEAGRTPAGDGCAAKA